MQVRSIDGKFVRLSGRIGDFIFRTFKSGKMFATYAPRDSRSIQLPISVHFRKQMQDLNLEIVEHHKSSTNNERND